MINTDLIEKYKDSVGITYEAIAASLKVTRMTLNNILNNRTCNLETFIAIADLINVSTDELLDRDVNSFIRKENEEGGNTYKKPSLPDNLVNNKGEVYNSKKIVVEKTDVKSLIDTVHSQQRTIEYLVKK